VNDKLWNQADPQAETGWAGDGVSMRPSYGLRLGLSIRREYLRQEKQNPRLFFHLL